MQFKIRHLTQLLIILSAIYSNYTFAQYNSAGQVGYINTPSAKNSQEGDIGIVLNKSSTYRKLSVLVSPFDWMDANIFYVDIPALPYGPDNKYKQSYKDKGFSLKFSIPIDNNTLFAIGANDLAGTGFFNSEYIVLTKSNYKFEYTLGVGWGAFSDGISFKNPLINIDENFRFRSDFTKDRGGNIDFNNYFSGERASLFFGAKYYWDHDVSMAFEYDPTDYQSKNIPYPESKTNFNIAYEKIFENLSLKASYLRGNEFSLQLALRKNFLEPSKTAKYIKKPQRVDSYIKLKSLLSSNNIGLKSIETNETDMIISVRQNAFQNQYSVNKIIKDASRELSKNYESIVISQNYLDMETTEIKYPTKKYVNIRKEDYVNTQSNEKKYVTTSSYPIINSSFAPTIRPFIAGREQFFIGGLLIENNSEIIFRDNLVLLSNFKLPIYSNFNKLIYPADEPYKNVVRSDVKDYLRNLKDKIAIGRLELNYFKSFNKKHFFRYSFGIFEDMFAGTGIDYVFYPEGAYHSFGAELYQVKKRDYDWSFGFLDYKNTIARVTAQVLEPKTRIKLKVSVGEYLAGDEGYTFEIARRFDNGVEYSAFFTRTNVSKEVFGEGSFDKGIRLKIPFSFFNRNNRSFQKYEWHPLTKDPGSMLIKSVDLHDEITRSRIY